MRGVAVVKALLEQDVIDVEKQDAIGSFALIWPREQNFQMFKALLIAGADVSEILRLHSINDSNYK